MTEAEWLTCDDPAPMLELLKRSASARKLRLFVADSARVLASTFGQEQEEVAEMQERVAEVQATEEDLEWLLLRDMPELWEHRAPGGNLSPVWDTARMVARDRFKLAPLAASITQESRAAENADMCGVLREIFGNPFRPVVVDPAWRAWNGGAVVKMAQVIYDERRFGDLPILADALEEAGCDEGALLGHCRRAGGHVRGCWALDAVLNKR